MIRQQVLHTPAMIRDPGGHCWCLRRATPVGPKRGEAETRMQCTKVVDRTNQIHAMLQRQCATCQRPAPACQRGEAFTERRVQPVTVGRRIAPPTAAPERRV